MFSCTVLMSSPDAIEVDGVGVPHVVKSGVWTANPLYDAFETVIDASVGKIIPDRACKDRIPFDPQRAGFHAHAVLTQLLQPEALQHKRGKREDTHFAVFGRNKP